MSQILRTTAYFHPQDRHIIVFLQRLEEKKNATENSLRERLFYINLDQSSRATSKALIYNGIS